MCQVPAGTSVCEWPGALAPGAPRRCVREGSMSAMERTTYRRSLVAGGLVVSAFARFKYLGVRRTPKGSAARTPHVRAVNGFLLR